MKTHTELKPGMLRSMKELNGYDLSGSDGDIGKVEDFLFDDEYLIVRYLVANTRKWLPGRRVLLSPPAFRGADQASRKFEVDLTRDQIKHSPTVELDQPVHRKMEEDLARHYQWPAYWTLGTPVGGPLIPPEAQIARAPVSEPRNHLRSASEVTGYHIQARDGEIGHVEDFIFDDEQWQLRYLVVDTRNLLPGKKVLVAPAWIRSVAWSDRKVGVDLTRKEIKESPVFDPTAPVNRGYEAKLYDYYGRPAYWK